MKITIDIPDEFINDYITDKFKDFFSRVAADIDYNGLCGSYENETAEMFLKAFEESGRKTKADEIRNMSDEELADYLTTIQEAYSCPCDYDGWLEELQSEAE